MAEANDGNYLVAGTLNFDAALIKVYAKTGKTIWKAPSPHGDIRGPVTVHEGTVYTITAEGWVAAYDARTGNAK